MRCFTLLLTISVQLSVIKVNLPRRSEYSAISKPELAYISAYLLTVLIYILATPKVMKKLFELWTTQIYAVKCAETFPIRINDLT